jgi:hypothetical protein
MSNGVECQAEEARRIGFHSVSLFIIVFMITSNFRMQATGLPLNQGRSSSSVPGATLTSVFPAVPIERSDSHELSDLLTVCLSKFRELRHENVYSRRANTWDRAQELLFLLPERTVLDSLLDLTLGLLQTLFQKCQMLFDVRTHGLGGGDPRSPLPRPRRSASWISTETIAG